ncbi:hypothetical protein FDECE_2227 [Fusarium decemcellulare]|nr:hypothetical protein FDECE_2227 [Fusarium decemcellulare]
MSFSHPRRRTPVTRPGSDTENALSLKTNSTLRKGATFHSPTSPVTSDEDLFVPPRLPRSQSHLDDVVDANCRRIALTLNDIDEALSKTEELSLSPKSPKNKPKSLRDTSLPIPRGFLEGPIVDPAMTKEEERRVLRPRSVRRSRHHASDSGLGTSVASTNEKRAAVTTSKKETKEQVTRSAITRSAVAASTTEKLPSLGPKAINRIHEHTLRPLLAKPTLKDFEPIVLDIPRRIRSKEIICLRDLEKTLIFMAPVSQLLTDNGVWGNTYRMLCVKERTKSAALYLDFCLTSVRCIQATVEYLSDREQIRPADRPYTNGYFIDLKDQILEYGKQLAAKANGDDMDVDAYVPSFVPLDYPTNSAPRSDEVKLIGGINENGRPAQLVRVRQDGTYISLETGKPVDVDEAPMKMKRSLSQQLEDEEEIQRSMARRKKNASPEELAPKRCREPGCNKEFKRPCDLTKHEKTHSRPWKCPVPTCKYHDYGWPTEKEMDRHHNDKHSDAPAMFECLYKPCPYKSKRESNCKQHMEKAHGWTYVRTKTNGKKLPSQPASSAQQTPPLGNVSTPSTTPTYSGVPTPPQHDVAQFVGGDFPLYPTDSDWMSLNNIPTETLDLDLGLDTTSPASASSYEQYAPYQNGSAFILDNEDLYAAHMQLPAQLPTPEQAVIYNPNPKMMAQQLPMYQAHQPVPVPTGAPHFSPTGQETAMLFTPNSLRDVDEGFDDSFAGEGMDFPLFPSGNGMTTKTNEYQSLFGEMPSANMGFSQNSQQDMFNMDWSSMDFQQNLSE